MEIHYRLLYFWKTRAILLYFQGTNMQRWAAIKTTQIFLEIIEQSDIIGSTQKYLINEAIKQQKVFF
jgi:hypothetical protein